MTPDKSQNQNTNPLSNAKQPVAKKPVFERTQERVSERMLFAINQGYPLTQEQNDAFKAKWAQEDAAKKLQNED